MKYLKKQSRTKQKKDKDLEKSLQELSFILPDTFSSKGIVDS